MSRLTEVIALASQGATRAQLARSLAMSEDAVELLLDDAARYGLAEVAEPRLADRSTPGCRACAPDTVMCAGCPLYSAKHENIPL
ncbi:MAG: hypothetical protein CVT64_07805 [Actinobacteria bacterium HGW-Actinobacteria-4]|nr:MAG: hypothetical protein CVT64_07805 [Actinobacteria bacterium HGW-Actinobacteria-4]